MGGAGVSGAPKGGPALPGVGGDTGGGKSRRRGRGRGNSRAAATADSQTPNNEIEPTATWPPLRAKVGAIRPADMYRSPFNSSSSNRTCTTLRWRWPTRSCIEITQVEFHHAKDFTPQGKDDKKGTPDQTGRAGMFMAPGMPNVGGRKPSQPGRGEQGPMPGMPGSAAAGRTQRQIARTDDRWSAHDAATGRRWQPSRHAHCHVARPGYFPPRWCQHRLETSLQTARRQPCRSHDLRRRRPVSPSRSAKEGKRAIAAPARWTATTSGRTAERNDTTGGNAAQRQPTTRRQTSDFRKASSAGREADRSEAGCKEANDAQGRKTLTDKSDPQP